jgi:Zn-dependent peptidase ImmA (M78 family)/DNA-binding XRE family transcriptional regulator
MSRSDRIPVVPAVLKWARESAGLDRPRAAKLVGVNEATVHAWETGELQPTIKQLRTAAQRYYRPLAVLLLAVPPTHFDAMHDFRRADLTAGHEWSPRLHTEYRRALSQREVMLELAEVSPGSLTAPGEQLAIAADTSTEDSGGTLRRALRLDETKPDWSQPHDALNACIRAVEDLGVLVVQTQRVDVSEMKGFSVAEWPFPAIALNGGDWPRSRLFTLFHELAHLALDAGGLCDLHEVKGSPGRSEDAEERRCNQVAAAALMPRSAFVADPLVSRAGDRHAWTVAELSEVSSRHGASAEAVLLRLVGLGLATWGLYWQRKAELDKGYAEARELERERRRQTKGGPSYWVVHARDLAHGYVTSVLDAFYSRAISSLDVADYLDVRFDQLPKLETAVFR